MKIGAKGILKTMRSKDTKHEECVARLEKTVEKLEQKVKDQERIIKELQGDLEDSQETWGFSLFGDEGE